MAALLTHVLQFGKSNLVQNLNPLIKITVRTTFKYLRKKIKVSKPFIVPKVEKVPLKAVTNSLSTRGFLRNIKEYKPPDNAAEKVDQICQKMLGTSNHEYRLVDDEVKSRLLITCSKEFDYKIPNSLLATIDTVADVKNFYTTPIDTTVPYDALKNMDDLPPNLHIQTDYHRFHPDTDTMFNGVSAFPKSSVLVTGLKYREKYKGFYAGNPFTDI